MSVVAPPKNSVFSFGLGVCGLIVPAFIVALILCDPLWRVQPDLTAAGAAVDA